MRPYSKKKVAPSLLQKGKEVMDPPSKHLCTHSYSNLLGPNNFVLGFTVKCNVWEDRQDIIQFFHTLLSHLALVSCSKRPH